MTTSDSASVSSRWVKWWAAVSVSLLLCGPSYSQFAMVPTPLPAPHSSSDAETELAYAVVAAKHIYATFPIRIFKGRLPPLLYGVAVTETDIDGKGNVVEVRMRRKPSAPEVEPWILSLIRRAGPFPAPTKLGKVTHVEVWLVHRSGNFQLHTLTEGQD